MKFAHLADCHIGGWRDPKMRDISTTAFLQIIDKCIHEKVDFVLIAGDLFNTSLPGVERLRIVTEKLKELYDNNIPCYLIAGSHDYSPSGKTMLDVLESAGLCINVAKGKEINGRLQLSFTTDKKTGVKITGLPGLRGGLDKNHYRKLLKENLEKEPGEKIFMFHCSINELKPSYLKEMEAEPLSILPRGFNYYAGGHVHIIEKYSDENYPAVVYPGPGFPNSFSELEKLQQGGFYIVENWKLRYVPILIYPTHHIVLEIKEKNAEEVTEMILEEIKNKKLGNTMITIRIFGKIIKDKPSDIDFKKIFKYCYDQGAYFVMKNTHKLESDTFQEIQMNTHSVQDIEKAIILEHAGQQKLFSEEEQLTFVQNLMHILNEEKSDGERINDFEERLFAGVDNIFIKKMR